MLKSLNAESLKIVSGLYDTKPGFRAGLDRLLHDEVKDAVNLSKRLSEFMSASDADASKTTTVKKAVKKTPSGKKRGRPPGSSNKNKTPKSDESTQTVVEPVEAKMTHGHAILQVLAGNVDGLMASEILEAISNAKIENYEIPSKQTLQTTLVGLKAKKAIKTKGSRPNTKYLVK